MTDTIRSAPDPLVALRKAIEQELEAIRVCTHCDDASPRDQGRLTALRWVLGQVKLATGRRAALDSIEEGSRETKREIREWAKNVVRGVPSVHIRNTDAVPTFKRRPDACIDRAAVLLALEHEPLVAASPSREGAGLDERMLRWVAAQPIGYGDWACRDCRPDSDMLVGGFRCMVHEARARLASEEQREDGPR